MELKHCFIMRGIPGSGKSTTAKLIAGETGHIHSTDNYFMVDGEYKFDPKLLKDNHEKNFKAFCADIEAGHPLVILDNTNTCKWEFEKYKKVAQEHGYIISIVENLHPTIEESMARNTHGVPAEAIQRMVD